MSAADVLSRTVSTSGHICLVVDDDDAYVEIAERFLAEGDARQEKTVAFGPQDSPAQQRLRLLAATAADPYVDVLGRTELEPERMFAMFRREATAARDQGYRRLRVAADMDWLLPATRSWEDALRFEVLLDRVVSELDAIVLCAYRRSSFAPDTILGMLCTHPTTAGHTEREPFKLVAGADGCWVVSGELDIAASSVLGPALEATAGDPWVVDASGVTFADVSGMRAFALVAEGAGRTLQVRGAPDRLKRHWELAGFDRVTSRVAFGC